MRLRGQGDREPSREFLKVKDPVIGTRVILGYQNHLMTKDKMDPSIYGLGIYKSALQLDTDPGKRNSID